MPALRFRDSTAASDQPPPQPQPQQTQSPAIIILAVLLALAVTIIFHHLLIVWCSCYRRRRTLYKGTQHEHDSDGLRRGKPRLRTEVRIVRPSRARLRLAGRSFQRSYHDGSASRGTEKRSNLNGGLEDGEAEGIREMVNETRRQGGSELDRPLGRRAVANLALVQGSLHAGRQQSLKEKGMGYRAPRYESTSSLPSPS